jgi:hypothetical protein
MVLYDLDLEKELKNITFNEETYSELINCLTCDDNPLMPDSNASISFPSGNRIEFSKTYLPMHHLNSSYIDITGEVPISNGVLIKVFSADNKLLFCESVGYISHMSIKSFNKENFAKIIKDFVKICSSKSESIKEKIYELEKQRTTVRDNSSYVWGYIDFIYFSTITQTTVGYGDILPNSRFVRILVIFQILFGYFLIAVLLNISFGEK